MLADVNDIGATVLVGGRGGKRPGAGRPKLDGSRPKAPPPPVPDFDVFGVDDLLGFGPPPPLVPPPEYSSDSDDDLGGVTMTLPDNPVALYAGARARKEAALAAKAELEFRVKAGLYLPREAVRASLAVTFQTIVQSLRSLPDNLERKLGLSPDAADAIGIAIDEMMGDLSSELERIHTTAYAVSETG